MSHKLDLTRQSSLATASIFEDVCVSVVGVGAIGSHVVECLAKMGVNKFKIWDFDEVDTHNLPNQGFGLPDLGRPKVEALKERIEIATGAEIEAFNEAANIDTDFGTRILVAAADKMSVRKELFENAKASPDVELFLDTRMGALVAFTYLVDMSDPQSIAAYEGTMFTDEEAEPVPCTEKATIFCAWSCAAHMSSAVFEFLRGGGVPVLPMYIVTDFVNRTVSLQGG